MTEPDVEFLTPTGARLRAGFCERNLNLLAHAQAIELDIGSRCGGHGICGGDKVRVTSTETPASPRLSPLTEAEHEHLSTEEIAQGWRLACQCFPDLSTQSLRAEVR